MVQGENNNPILYLYSHSPDAERLVQSGEAVISTGGARRRDGTVFEMAKPFSATLNDLKEMFGNDAQLAETDKRIEQLTDRFDQSQNGMMELSKIVWMNNAALGQVFSITHEGFQQTLNGLNYLSSHMEEFEQYVRQKDISDFKEKTNRFMTNLATYASKLGIATFDITNSNVEEHLNEIYAFIKRFYDDYKDGTSDCFFACKIINALLVPFTAVMIKYSVLFYYENGIIAGSSNKWAELVFSITSDHSFIQKTKYYIFLETELPYREKVRKEKEFTKYITKIPELIKLNSDYALYHSKEEYLDLPKEIQKLISSPDQIPADGKIYL